MPSLRTSSSPQLRKEKKTINACVECYRRKQKCDRNEPCSNCVSRNVTSKCHYSHPRISGTTEEPIGTRIVQAPAPSDETHAFTTAVEPQAADMGYSSTAGSNALVDFKQLFPKVDGLHAVSTAHHHPFQRPEAFTTSSLANDRLPSRMAINKLVEFFFDDVNWQYFILEKQYFDCLVTCWYGTSVETLSHLSHKELGRELHYFPALLFQVLGLAIQFLPLNSTVWEFLSQADMALCQKYSDIGVELMRHAQGEIVALTKVQADFLRASWLKNIGKGVESWRTVGNAIRSAQELELHRHKSTHEQRSSSPRMALSRVWYEEYKRRLWMNLCIWDSLTAMILGRPRAIHPDDCDVEEPTECDIPQDPSTCVPATQVVLERDRPNTVSSNLFLYRLSNVWHTVKALQSDRHYPTDYSVVQQLHDRVNHIMDRLPPTLRHERPNLSWDNQYPYLRQQREDILTKANLVLMALHRPHIKYRAEARRAALQAALVILDSQHRSFMMARPHQYKLFGLSFYTIDASLLLSVVTATYLPQKDSEVVVKIDHVLCQAMNRLSIMHSYSPIARSGLAILRQCYHVLRTRLECDTAILNLPDSMATEPGNLRQESEADVLKDTLSELQPHPLHQQYEQHNHQESVSHAPTSLSSGFSASPLPLSNEPNSSQSAWNFDTNADAGFMATTGIQPPLHLGPSTTDFDETYWLNMINEIPDVLNIEPTEIVEIGGTVDAAALEYDPVWNQIQFFDSST
ncbi:hypothetical protein PV10_06087 [Exophiala mesophila]|uniref:Zn(2)-C6 fungal-type domain-containing protein n=3 Tax=Exophiala mesophila TaxID=212818 RepID=A0A0D1ZCC5_EXOME|nr:uncharacterized protein PV10_06087 [Exophiala mesophila]KIV91559.1 hypothetical protein PV10_06087 [Exophiala mesophila]